MYLSNLKIPKTLKKSSLYPIARKIWRIFLRIASSKSNSRRLYELENEIINLKKNEQLHFDEIFNFLTRIHPFDLNDKVFIKTDHPVAYDSPDHLFPSGTFIDNTTKPAFVEACFRYFKRKISYLDIGCAGGGLVRNFLEEDHFGIGIEGSDISLNNKRAEWGRIPSHLFTADLTKPLSLVDKNGSLYKFDVIGAWEVMEHFPEDGVDQVLRTVRSHLAEGGIFTASIATYDIPHTNHHQCVHDEEWWHKKLKTYDLYPIENQVLFKLSQFPRGGDIEDMNSPNKSIHVVCVNSA